MTWPGIAVRALWPPRPLEVVAAVTLALAGAGEVLVPFSSRQGTGSAASALVGVTVVSLGMLCLRRAPLVTFGLFVVTWATIALVAPTFTLFYGQMLPLEVVVFCSARFGRGRVPWIAAAVAVATLLTVDLTVPTLQEPGEIVFHWAVTVVVWSAGIGLRTLERRAHASTQRAIAAEVGAAEQAFRAVLEERTRIARELHDIVGHAVGSIVVQAGAAEQARDDAPFVAQALADIRATGNDALAEMRRLVSLLRDDGDVPLAPQPTLEALPRLVATVTGPQVTLAVSGDPRPLPAGVDLAAYRIVQEALTNVRRHAAAERCSVAVTYEPDGVRVEVVDDGRSAAAAPVPGHGLTGMRERACLYGGEVQAGPEPGGGFAVRAFLPAAT
ncbi:MAG: sensor histidine kinase [Angustibacter sp.]